LECPVDLLLTGNAQQIQSHWKHVICDPLAALATCASKASNLFGFQVVLQNAIDDSNVQEAFQILLTWKGIRQLTNNICKPLDWTQLVLTCLVRGASWISAQDVRFPLGHFFYQLERLFPEEPTLRKKIECATIEALILYRLHIRYTLESTNQFQKETVQSIVTFL